MKKIITNTRYTILTQKDFKWATDSEKDQLDFISSFALDAINKIKSRIENIKKIKSEGRTFENTILAFENISDEENIEMSHIHTLEMCSDRLAVREACRKSEIEMSAKIVDLIYDINLYKSIKDYYDNSFKLELNQKDSSGKNILDKQDIKLVADMMSDFARMGFDLPAAERTKIKSIEKKISKLASAYDARLAEDKSHILCTLEELDGVPENIISSFKKIKIESSKNKKELKKEIDSEYKYVVSVDYPEYGPYMKYANNKEKREELHLLFNNVGGMKNVKILEELIALRHQKSQILGHVNHGEYVTSDRMAKNTKNAYKMLSDITSKLKDKKNEELKDVIEKGESLGIKKSELKTSDVAYINTKIQNEKYNYNEQEIREYFPLEHVIKSMFDLFGDLFSFEMRESKVKLWHKDAKMYEMYDKNMRCVIGYMAMDLFPREGKFGHACMMPMISGKSLGSDNYRSGLVTLVCNFSKPDTKNKIPSLLTLGEVETLYHEFGHGIHSLLSKAKHNSHSGTNVVWDFVETPSQIMEEWVTEESVLKKISKHYVTGKSLSKNHIDKIKSLEKFMKATFYTRQCVQSLLDLDIYTGKLSGKSIVEHYHDLRKKHLTKDIDGVIFVCRFAHIARGYDAGYYSYLWAERISKDIYSEFKKRADHKNSNGKFKASDYKNFGLDYRKNILEMGSSRDENESVMSLLGRGMSNDSFVNSII